MKLYPLYLHHHRLHVAITLLFLAGCSVIAPVKIDDLASAAGCYGHDMNKPILQLHADGSITSPSGGALASSDFHSQADVSFLEVSPGLRIDPTTEQIVRSQEPISRNLISIYQGVPIITLGSTGNAAPYTLERTAERCLK
jgi:hypothetical protein